MKLPSAEEILREKFKNNFLDEEYVELHVEAMLEHSKQAVKFALEVQAGKACLEHCKWDDGDCAVVDHQSNPFKIDKSSITDFDYSQIK